ncbi:tyrosine-type recombinase/integrase [Nocardiopsis ansamitocini]|uniref:Integrase n=1 Tax=Nocardiopsis ansamitocini TaxID=1670832 RepID=A0A9W6PAA1_9ACTN|nr:integrase [Nocardiopsis ansamitocini]GLU49853.1 integrase [Nocardiopsis ansamitocini]
MSNQHQGGRPVWGGRPASLKVNVWKLHKYVGKRATTYTVRWTVDGTEFREPFGTRAAATAYQAEIVSARQRGEPFDTASGKPLSWLKEQRSWLEFACSYVDMKWETAAPNSRRSIAEALTDVTEALLSTDRSMPDRSLRREVLRDWAFSTRLWGDPLPERLKPILRWLERNTVDVSALSDPVLARRSLERLSRKLDGTLAAANTTKRKRMVFNNTLEYACEIGLLPANPIKHIRWTRERAAPMVNPNVVVNAAQAKTLLKSIGEQPGHGPRVKAFYALLYYAALRPEEAICLARPNLERLPDQGWGEIVFSEAEPRAGTKYNDSRKSRQKRQLKHRATGEDRRVPVHPDLVEILLWHVEEFNIAPGGRLFIGPRGGVLAEWAYLGCLAKAREAAFTAEEAASPLAKEPYDLRHAAVSTWLNAGVPAAQVADWAGHSVDVLLRVYAKCVAGQQAAALDRIQRSMEEMTRDDDD